MGTPGSIRDQTLKDLRTAYRNLTTASARSELADQNPAIRREVGQLIGKLWLSIGELENAQLAAIAADLVREEGALLAATVSLRQRTENLDQIAEVIRVGAQVLGVLAQILPLLAL